MSDKRLRVSRNNGRARRSISRRRFVQAVSATGAAGSIALAGCVADDDDDDQVIDDPDELEVEEEATIQIYADSDFEDAEDAFYSALQEAGLHEDVDVDVIGGPSDTDDRRDQITSDLEANRTEPDLMLTDSGWTMPFIAREQTLNLEANMPSDVIDHVHSNYFEAAVDTATDLDGELHALPVFPDFPTMLYRKDLFEETGYDPEEEGWETEPPMMEEFSHMIADVQDAHDLDYGYTTQADSYEGLACCTFNEVMTSWGGSYFGDHENLYGPINDRPITVDEEPVHNAIRMMRTFIYGEDDEESLDDFAPGISSPDILAWIEDDSLGPFEAGNAAVHRNWPYAIAASDEQFGDDLGVMPIPGVVDEGEAEYEGTGGVVSALGGWHMVVNPNTENLAAALNVLEAMTEDVVQQTLFEEIGWLPPQGDLFDDDEIREIGAVGAHMDALQEAGDNAVPRPVTEAWPTQASSVYQEVHDAYSQQKSPEEAMGDLESQLQEIEEQY